MVDLDASGYNDLYGETVEAIEARHASLGSYLGLRGATVEDGIDLRCSELDGNLDMFEAETGRFYGWSLDVARKLDMARAKVDGGMMLRSASIESTLHAYDADIDGDLDLKRAEIGDVNLQDATLETLKLSGTETYAIDLRGAELEAIDADDVAGYDFKLDGATDIEETPDAPVFEAYEDLTDSEREALAVVGEDEFGYGVLEAELGEAASGVLGSLVAKDVVASDDNGYEMTAYGSDLKEAVERNRELVSSEKTF